MDSIRYWLIHYTNTRTTAHLTAEKREAGSVIHTHKHIAWQRSAELSFHSSTVLASLSSAILQQLKSHGQKTISKIRLAWTYMKV